MEFLIAFAAGLLFTPMFCKNEREKERKSQDEDANVVVRYQNKDELEALKSQLMNDILGERRTKERVPMEKVVMLIWTCRDDPKLGKFMTRFVTKYANSRDVFDGIEFYLPQLAHMIIHLDMRWDDFALEMFALMVAQQSLHFALQLIWILNGAMEDYQPELASGLPNPSYDPLFYSRCSKFLNNLERCVVYGRPRSQQIEAMYEAGTISKDEYRILQEADRRFHVMQITSQAEEMKKNTFGGTLLYKRRLKSRPWKKRYFAIEERMLCCYSRKGGFLLRAMSLEGATVGEVSQEKLPYMFFVSNRGGFYFQMRANNEEERNMWMSKLRASSQSIPLLRRVDHAGLEVNPSELTPEQRARYDFFRGEQDFVRSLIEVPERLRFVEDRAERKLLAPNYVAEVTVPPISYVPLCSSTDLWRRVEKSIPDETILYNTNERCLTVLYFTASRDTMEDLEVAEFLNRQFQFDGVKDSPKLIESSEEEKKVDVLFESEPPSQYRDPGDPEPIPPRIQKFLENNVAGLPRKIASRFDQRRHGNVTDLAEELERLPIIDQTRSRDEAESSRLGEESFASAAISDLYEEGDIDPECIDRAKKIVGRGECWSDKSARMLEKAAADAKEPDSVEIASLIAKSNDDLRQEVFIMQMLHFYKSLFARAGLPLWLKTYRILSTSRTTGLIEVLTDAISLDALKKSAGYPQEGGLRRYFEQTYGGPKSPSFRAAQRNFMQSLAAYSLVSYLLGLKDRHNGNIMIDIRGHVIFIDFGFAFGRAPGHEFSIERAPFKLTQEMVELMDGPDSKCFQEFTSLFVAGLAEARKNSEIALGLVEIMMFRSTYPCFTGHRYGRGKAFRRFEDRLMLRIPDDQVEERARKLVACSLGHSGTVLYDVFQKWSNGYEI